MPSRPLAQGSRCLGLPAAAWSRWRSNSALVTDARAQAQPSSSGSGAVPRVGTTIRPRCRPRPSPTPSGLSRKQTAVTSCNPRLSTAAALGRFAPDANRRRGSAVTGAVLAPPATAPHEAFDRRPLPLGIGPWSHRAARSVGPGRCPPGLARDRWTGSGQRGTGTPGRRCAACPAAGASNHLPAAAC